MNRTPIKSSSILSAGYDPEKREMEIEFCSMALYLFSDIEPGLWRAFMQSHSKGKFFAEYVRHRKYVCIRPRPTQGDKSHGDPQTDNRRKKVTNV
jgi:hypothetical protein